MGKDAELPDHFGSLHNANLTPHRAICTLAVISAAVGIVGMLFPFADGTAPSDATIAALPHGFWSSFGYLGHDKLAVLPNTLLTVTLASNFRTFVLYALSCVICMVAYYKHPKYNALKHLFIPVFGLAANLACMAFYLIGPFMGYGTKMGALACAANRSRMGSLRRYLLHRSSKSTGRTTLITRQVRAASM